MITSGRGEGRVRIKAKMENGRKQPK